MLFYTCATIFKIITIRLTTFEVNYLYSVTVYQIFTMSLTISLFFPVCIYFLLTNPMIYQSAERCVPLKSIVFYDILCFLLLYLTGALLITNNYSNSVDYLMKSSFKKSPIVQQVQFTNSTIFINIIHTSFSRGGEISLINVFDIIEYNIVYI